MPSDSQTDRRTLARLLVSPVFLALVVTSANAIKPVLIDDTAYLTYARHIAVSPSDPYGFTIFWYTVPDSAFEVLAPPVIPYWLALGITLFGESIWALKLWLFPFVWLFAWSTRELMRRFARGSEYLLPIIVLSPGIFPSVNLMLDVPALALGLAAVVLLTRSSDRSSWRLAIASGLIAAVAMQTKYTMLLIPPAMAWYGLTHWRFRQSGLAIVVAILAFTAWELFLVSQYGRSHFIFHALDQSSSSSRAEDPISAFLQAKSDLVGPLAGHLGGLGAGIGLVAGSILGVKRRWLLIATIAWTIGFAVILFVPYHWTVLVPAAAPGGHNTTAIMVFWQLFGWLVLLALAGSAFVLTFGLGKGLRLRLNTDALFLVGWLLIELVGYFVLTPFPAARRVLGIVTIGGILVSRVVSRLGRVHPDRRSPRWMIVFGIGTGVAIAAIDTLDAFPEKAIAERAAARIANQQPGSTVWFAGHWGFQYYCERAGMRPLVPGESILAAGDLLVLPIHPEEGFHRPHIGSVRILPPEAKVELIAEEAWRDPLSAQTIPNYYGGIDPVTARDGPRLRVNIYRLRSDWRVPLNP